MKQSSAGAGRARTLSVILVLGAVAGTVTGFLAGDSSVRAVCVGLSVVLLCVAGAAWKTSGNRGDATHD